MSTVKQTRSPNGTWQQRAAEVQEQITHAPEQLGECVEDYPISSVLAAFGIGLVAGAGVVALYCSQSQAPSSSYDSYARKISDAIRDAMPRGVFS